MEVKQDLCILKKNYNAEKWYCIHSSKRDVEKCDTQIKLNIKCNMFYSVCCMF